ncbi:sulfotransferase [Halospina sp. K52047b]|uniref:sulfotransferase n=1 Tax=Halospina sp. K52047b TaxID=2614160 RepID=UPI00124A2CAF|nr:sulfotransferase [Halospina sp. K52047b]KAA8976810.1 sulfotransferase [Halospina sp. K52047b]
MNPSFRDLNLARKPEQLKDPGTEKFLENMNEALRHSEHATYKEEIPQYPFIFIIGLPRSGTTLLSQVIAAGLEVGYIDNLAARFWLAPVTGIRLSQSIFGSKRVNSFQSHYGATQDPVDVHEFGYFWRHWLGKQTFADIKNARVHEDNIDWNGLRRSLANMQQCFNAPMSFKNIYGSYHMARMQRELGKVLYIYIERDPVDVAVSILKARERHYSDLNKWWSYVPPEYEKLLDKDYWTQIAGQVHYLTRYYRKEFADIEDQRTVLSVTFEELCKKPESIVEAVRNRLWSVFDCQVSTTGTLPTRFNLNAHSGEAELRSRFAELLEDFRRNDP